jgi:hypothetical protein
MGLFCLIFFASFFLILKVLCDGYKANIKRQYLRKTHVSYTQNMERSGWRVPFSRVWGLKAGD